MNTLYRHIRKHRLFILALSGTLAIYGCAEWIARRYVNQKLQLVHYVGTVRDVDLKIWRGAYTLQGVEIRKRTALDQAPFFEADTVEISVHYPALWNGLLVGSLAVTKPVVNFIDSNIEERDQSGSKTNWIDLIDSLAAFRIDEFSATGGRVNFLSALRDPPVEISARSIEIVAHNLTNSTDTSQGLVASLQVSAELLESGRLQLELNAVPRHASRYFDLDATIKNVPLNALSALSDVYTPIDVEGGTLDIAMELAASDGKLQGYIKPSISDLSVFSWEADVKEDRDNVFNIAWEVLVEGVSELLESSRERDQALATRLEISAETSSPEVNWYMAIYWTIYNAFIDSIQPLLEESISVEERALVPESE